METSDFTRVSSSAARARARSTPSPIDVSSRRIACDRATMCSPAVDLGLGEAHRNLGNRPGRLVQFTQPSRERREGEQEEDGTQRRQREQRRFGTEQDFGEARPRHLGPQGLIAVKAADPGPGEGADRREDERRPARRAHVHRLQDRPDRLAVVIGRRARSDRRLGLGLGRRTGASGVGPGRNSGAGSAGGTPGLRTGPAAAGFGGASGGTRRGAFSRRQGRRSPPGSMRFRSPTWPRKPDRSPNVVLPSCPPRFSGVDRRKGSTTRRRISPGPDPKSRGETQLINHVAV